MDPAHLGLQPAVSCCAVREEQGCYQLTLLLALQPVAGQAWREAAELALQPSLQGMLAAGA